MFSRAKRAQFFRESPIALAVRSPAAVFVEGEKAKLYLRFDMLNVFNRPQFNGPSTDPLNPNLGVVTARTAAVNRFLQFQARIQL